MERGPDHAAPLQSHERIVRVDTFHEREAAIQVRELIDQAEPVVKNRFGAIGPGVVEQRIQLRLREFREFLPRRVRGVRRIEYRSITTLASPEM